MKKIADLLEITPQTLNSRLKAKAVREDFLVDIERVTGNVFHTYTADVINTGSMTAHNLKSVVEDGGHREKAYLQQIDALKADITRLEDIIKSKDETIAAKDETIRILTKR